MTIGKCRKALFDQVRQLKLTDVKTFQEKWVKVVAILIVFQRMKKILILKNLPVMVRFRDLYLRRYSEIEIGTIKTV